MIEWFVERLIGLMGPIANLSKEKRELRDNALNALSIAFTETSLYVNGPNRERNREKEEILAKYWAAAAIPIRHLDQEFAEMCQYKSAYWINPENWKRESLQKPNFQKTVIKLSEVKNKLMELMNN